MRLIEAIILGLIQGLTEFFPISSSGHLLLVPPFLEELLPGLDFSLADTNLDILLHTATYVALLIAYRKPILAIAQDLPKFKSGLVNLVLASLPVGLVGAVVLVVFDGVQVQWLGIVSVIFVGLLLIWTDLRYPASTEPSGIESGDLGFINEMSAQKALGIGLLQATAVVRGTSRSGITLLGGIWLGLTRRQAIDFAFLSGLLVFTGLTVGELILTIGSRELGLEATATEAAVAWVVAAISAYLVIVLFRGFGQRQGVLAGFGIYRIVIGVILAAVLLV